MRNRVPLSRDELADYVGRRPKVIPGIVNLQGVLSHERRSLTHPPIAPEIVTTCRVDSFGMTLFF